MRISVIKDSGHHEANKIFAGVYGLHTEDGRFKIDPNLKRVAYLFELLEAPGSLPGINLGLKLEDADSLYLDVPDPAVPFVNGMLLNAMSQRWSHFYDGILGGMRLNGLAAAALSNDKATTLMRTQSELKGLGLSLFEVPVTMKAKSASAIAQLADYTDDAEQMVNHVLPDLRTLAMTEAQIGNIVDLGQDALGVSVREIAAKRAEAAMQIALAAATGAAQVAPANPVAPRASDADVTEIDLSELSGLLPGEAAEATSPSEPPPAELPASEPRISLSGSLRYVLGQSGISPSSDRQLVADMEATLYIPAKNALEAAQMVGLLRSLAEQANDPMLTAILTPIPKSLHNPTEGEFPVYISAQNDIDDGDDDDDGDDRFRM